MALAIVAALVFVGCGDGGGGGGGDAHALGEEVAVGYVDYTDSGERGAETTIGVTVLAVRQGTQQDLTDGGLEVDPEDQDTTPYYVDARYENQGDEAITRNLDISLEDTDGNLINSTFIFDFGGGEPFEECPQVTEGKLAPGDSYESCTLFLVPEGIEVGQVSFLSDNGEGKEPEFVYWESSD